MSYDEVMDNMRRTRQGWQNFRMTIHNSPRYQIQESIKEFHSELETERKLERRKERIAKGEPASSPEPRSKYHSSETSTESLPSVKQLVTE